MSSGNHSEGIESQPHATLCSGGCGFFANVGTSGLCSKCYREMEQAQQNFDAVAQKAAAAIAQPNSSSPCPMEIVPTPRMEQDCSGTDSPAPTVSEPSTAPSGSTPPPPSNPSRCNVAACRKKLGLTGFKCRCGHTFCGQHRHAESHACTFDYKTFERLKIADSNPQIQAAKIQKI